jgi:hypothetical protein
LNNIVQFLTRYALTLHVHLLIRTATFLLAAILLQGCSASWPWRERPVVPTTGKQPAPTPLVTPTTSKTAINSAQTVSLHSEVPVLLTVPEVKVVRSVLPLAPIQAKQALPPVIVPPSRVAPPVVLVPSASSGNPPAGAILPPGMFAKPSMQALAIASLTPPAPEPAAGSPAVEAAPVVPTAVMKAVAVAGPANVSKARRPQVLLYASPTTRAHFAALGMDYQNGFANWENLLRRHDVRFELVSSLDSLMTSVPDVLLLPSAVALTDTEKRSIADFRERGGSVLASWLTGVRGESGQWLGFGFMEQTLNTRVLGNTEAAADDTFVIPHGDNPVLHNLPAGLRVWIDRAPEWFALRLKGAHSAAEIMDWSRSVKTGSPSSVLAFDERVMASGRASRSVVLGYPERLWSANERGAMETIALDALNWLARQPDAYAAAWPWPFRSALVVAVDAADKLTEGALRYAKLAEELGGGATYFVSADQVESSAALLKDIQSRGHEIAYLGDQFIAFKDQPADTQAQRLDSMVAAMNATGIELGHDPGFRAPMESYDAITEGLLSDRGFSYLVGDPGSSPARLPAIVAGKNTDNKLVNLPRTQSGPDDALTRGDWATALSDFADEFTLAQQMAGLGVIRIPGQSALSEAQWVEVAKHMKANSPSMWTATAGRIAAWWRERGRVRVTLDAEVTPPLLTVVVSGTEPLRQPVSVLVNLPQTTSLLSLVGDAEETGTPKVLAFDKWRHAVILEGLAPGTHHWFLSFDRPQSASK